MGRVYKTRKFTCYHILGTKVRLTETEIGHPHLSLPATDSDPDTET